jgi:phosphoenolpyruvate carboxylase
VTDLLHINAYRGSVYNRQEVMVAYFDSSMDSGRFTAAWQQPVILRRFRDLAKNKGASLQPERRDSWPV